MLDLMKTCGRNNNPRPNGRGYGPPSVIAPPIAKLVGLLFRCG